MVPKCRDKPPGKPDTRDCTSRFIGLIRRPLKARHPMNAATLNEIERQVGRKVRCPYNLYQRFVNW